MEMEMEMEMEKKMEKLKKENEFLSKIIEIHNWNYRTTCSKMLDDIQEMQNNFVLDNFDDMDGKFITPEEFIDLLNDIVIKREHQLVSERANFVSKKLEDDPTVWFVDEDLNLVVCGDDGWEIETLEEYDEDLSELVDKKFPTN